MDWIKGIQFFDWPEILDYHFKEWDNKSSKEAQEFSKIVLSEAHLFLILGDELPTVDLSQRTFDDPLNLPFRVCVFECLSNKTLDIEIGDRLIPMKKLMLRFNFLGACEMNPGNYFYFGAGIKDLENSHTKLMMMFTSDDASSEDGKLLARAMKARLQICLELLNQESTIVGRVMGKPVKLKKKIEGTKEFVKFKPITIVRPKKVEPSEKTDSILRKVDWTHRFEVRGHWRRIKGLGKNREEVYCIEGFTWVRNHIKGDEALPVIRKTRIIQTINPLILKENK